MIQPSISYCAHLRLSRAQHALLIIVSLCFSPGCWGQITNVTNDQSAPMLGRGHDYLGGLSEIVDPANGSLSMRIAVPLPAARKMQIPFQFAYNSNGINRISAVVGSRLATASNKDAGFMEQGGWAYTFPTLGTSQIQLKGTDPRFPSSTCTVYTSFMFSPPDGSRHALGLSLPNNPQCNQAAPQPAVAAYYQAHDDFYYASTPDGGSSGINSPGNLTFLVSDTKGTTYHFSGLFSNGSCTSCNIPDFIEDSNGNITRFTQGPVALSVSEIDTTGRTVLNISSFGSAAGDVVTVSGTESPYKPVWSNVDYNFAFPVRPAPGGIAACAGVTDDSATGSMKAVTSLQLPNQQSYTFDYNSTYGLVDKITYPTGAYVKYTWGPSPQPSDSAYYPGTTNTPTACVALYNAIVILKREVFDGTRMTERQDFDYTTTIDPQYGVWTSKQTTVTTTDLVRAGTPSYSTVYTYSPLYVPDPPNVISQVASYVPVERTITYKDFGGAVLRTVTKSWNDTSQLKDVVTALDNGLISEVKYQYRGPDITQKDEFDYGSASPTRTTQIAYQSTPGSPYAFPAPIQNLPCKTTITQGSTLSSETDVYYDGGSVLCTSPSQSGEGLAGTSSLPSGTHDETYYSASATTLRGLPTKTIVKCFPDCDDATTGASYDVTGQLRQVTDPRGNTTKYDYTDNYSTDDGSPASGTGTNTYLTLVSQPQTNGITHTQQFNYGYGDGKLRSTTDENGQVTTYCYLTNRCTGTSFDPFHRLTETTWPNLGTTTYVYNDAGPATSVTTTTASTPDPDIVTVSTTDGMGRTVKTQQTSESATGTTVDTVYDGVGQILSVSNPYRSTSDLTYGSTQFTYDSLGRKLLQCQPDNGTGSSSCSAGTSYQKWTYTGPDTTFTDEAGHSWRQTTDGLGRLTNVVENAYVSRGGITCGGCTQSQIQTSYQYDALNNLLNATQSGSSEVRVGFSGGTTSDVARVRTFKYDSLSRLTVSTNPEAGTVCYGTVPTGQVPTVSNCTSGYDGNGNLQNKTDARGVTINYNYDALNRLTSKTYSNGTPTASFGYDGKDETGAALATPSLNAKGRLSRSVNATLGSNYSYDEMGRLKQQSYCFYGRCNQGFQVGAGYDLAGNMTSMTYPDGRTVEQDFDGAGRMSAVKYQSWNGTPHTASYLTATAQGGYDPTGHLVSATLGNVAQMAAGYDNRQRVNYLAYGTPAQLLWGKQYGWTSNSNLQTMTDGFTGIQRQFGYDTLNRLTSAQDIVGATAPVSNPIPFSTGTGSPTGTPTGNTSSSGAVPFWTDPNDSNVLTNPDSPGLANITNVGWQGGNGFNLYPGIQAPDGTLSATNFTSNLDSTDAFLIASVADPHPYAATTMTASVWLRAPNGAQDICLLFNDRGYSNWDTAGKLAHVTTEWQQFQVSKLTQRWLRDLEFMIGGCGTIGHGQTISIWNPMVEDSGTAGQTVTNLLPYSQRLGGSSWVISPGVSAYDMSALAPDGTNTASTVNADNDSSLTAVVPTLTPLSGISATGSVWLRSPSGSQNILLTLAEASGSGASSTLNTATFGLTGDWQRFQVSGLTQDTSRKLALQIGGGNTFNTGQSIQTWGAQVELGASAGPYVATAGKAVSAGTNLTNILPFSQQPNGPSWARTMNVAGVVNAVTAPDGSQTGYEATAGAGTSGLVDDVVHPALYDGDTLTGSVFLRSPSGSGSVTVYLSSTVNTANPQNVPIKQATIQLTHTWQRVVLTGQAPNALSRLYLQIGDSNSAGQTIDVWGAQMELASTAGPYVATSALAVVAGQELTNLLPHLQQLSGPEWGVVQGTITVNSAPGADGTMTAATITGNGSNSGTGTYVINEAPNPSYYDNQTMTASVFLIGPPGSSRNMYIYLVAQYDTGQTAILGSTNTSVGYDWQRVTVTGTTGNGLTKLYLQIGDPGSIFLTGDKLYVWGPQLVVGSMAAPYMPTPTTTTSPVTGQPGNLVANGLNETYSYDSFGNILQKGSFNNVYTANNQLFGYPYDAAGNLLSIGSVYNQVSMTYDAENRIASANGAIYDYDAEGNRIQKQGVALTETVYFGGRPVARFAGGWTDLIYGPTGLLAEVPGTENADPVFHLTDHLGTQVGSVNSSGILTNPLDYTPYGQIFSGSTNDPYFFTGKERDQESGLDYFGARYYGSNMGRFMSPDWSQTPQAIPYVDMENPQSLNLYGYALNNPLSNRDFDGHSINCDPDTTTTGKDGSVTVHAGACVSYFNFPAIAFAGLGNVMMKGHEAQGVKQLAFAYVGDFATGLATGQVLKGIGKIVSMAGGKIVVERVMSRAELAATESSGLLRGGRDGTHYVTDSVGTDSALGAQDRLALPNTPEVKVTMELDRSAVSGSSTVQPAFGQAGGGTERTATGNVSVKITSVKDMK